MLGWRLTDEPGARSRNQNGTERKGARDSYTLGCRGIGSQNASVETAKAFPKDAGWAFAFAKKPSAGYERRNHRREEFRRHRRRNYGSARYWNATGPDSCDWAESMSVAPSSRAVDYMSAVARSRDHCCKAAYCGSSAAVARKSDHCLDSWNGRYGCS